MEGPAHFVAMHSDNSQDIGYDLQIGKERLGLEALDDSTRQIVQEGDIYAVYLYKFVGNIVEEPLSLEWLGSGVPSKIKPAAQAVQPPAALGNYCTNCGSPNPAGARFCKGCGKPILA